MIRGRIKGKAVTEQQQFYDPHTGLGLLEPLYKATNTEKLLLLLTFYSSLPIWSFNNSSWPSGVKLDLFFVCADNVYCSH